MMSTLRKHWIHGLGVALLALAGGCVVLEFFGPMPMVAGASAIFVVWFLLLVRSKTRNESLSTKHQEQREDMLHLASHDLRACLRQISYGAEMQDSPDQKTRTMGRAYIASGVKRLGGILDSAQELLGVDDAPKNGVISLNDALAVAMEPLHSMAVGADAVLQFEALPQVKANAAQVASVFQNLLDNSLKYRREGVKPWIRVSAERSGGMIVVSVEDNGRGFSDKEGAFRMFKRLHTDVGEGTGKGLALVRRIVTHMDGTVDADSVPGQGTIVRFSLPKG